MMIVNEDSGVVNKLETSLSDDARVIIYNCHMFIVQATGAYPSGGSSPVLHSGEVRPYMD
jgi:hypothetical protein